MQKKIETFLEETATSLKEVDKINQILRNLVNPFDKIYTNELAELDKQLKANQKHSVDKYMREFYGTLVRIRREIDYLSSIHEDLITFINSETDIETQLNIYEEMIIQISSFQDLSQTEKEKLTKECSDAITWLNEYVKRTNDNSSVIEVTIKSFEDLIKTKLS